MKRVLIVFGLIGLAVCSACHSNKDGKAVITRGFPTSSWECFDFVDHAFELEKPTTYDLSLTATFSPDYTYNYFAMAFTVFDEEAHPLRSKDYRFTLKDRDGVWKEELTNGVYRFTFPINNELTLNEPGKYTFRIENCMPITPLTGIKEIVLINH